MKTTLKNIIVITLTIIITIYIFINKESTFSTIHYSTSLWYGNIVPSLFPLFIIADILINYNTSYYLSLILRPLSRIFKISNDALIVFILSIFSGVPSNARNTRKLYDDGLLDEHEASKILMFTHFSNPLFILGTVSIFFLQDKSIGTIILISHYIPNLIIGFIVRNYHPTINNKVKKEIKKVNFASVLTKSIISSIDTLLLILGIITCSLIISNFLTSIINLDPYNYALFKGILEMTIGLKEISLLSIPLTNKAIISAGILSFGGISIHMQVFSQISNTKIKYYPYFCSRIIHALLSGIIAYILLSLFR